MSSGHATDGALLLPAQFVQPPRDYPVDITSIHYGLLSPEDMHRLSVLPCRRVIGHVREYGINDSRLGVCDRMSVCATCGLRSVDCVGHAGHIDLEAPVFHIGFLPTVLRICRTICKSCSHVLLTEEEMVYYTRRLRAPNLDPQQRFSLVKQIQEDAYKTRVCVHCGGVNGVVRRVRPMRLVHEKYRVDLRRGEEANEDPEELLHRELNSAMQMNKDIAGHLDYVHEFLDPARVKQLFLTVPEDQALLLGLKPGTRPVDLLMTTLLVPPVCVRPRALSANQIREDDLTTQYNDILISSDALKDGTNDTAKYVENWEMLQTRAARLMDSAMPGFPAQLRTADVKSYAQRMKGKHGRFRGNLSGKRVDFSGRSVISPDPNLDIDELAVPLRVARVLTYPQRVFTHNLALMKRLVRNGPHVHPGAVTVFLAKEASRKSLNSARDRETIAARLAVGDIVERHVMNGDMVLFNRQPSLHRISMMAHRARVLPYRTFRFNECCCSPYNADFDGDEMNVHLVQTEEARAEALELMLTAKNIITARNGEPIIACTQDFLTAAYLVTARDAFFDRAQFTQLVSHWLGPVTQYELPIPAVLKPTELWTGKQLMELIIQPSPDANVLLNLEAKARFYSGGGKQNDPAEGFVSFLDSVYVSGRMDKKLLGGGAKDGLFARLYALTGGKYTARCMSRIAQFTSRYLQNYGFSLGLGDVAPTPSLNEKKVAVLTRSFAKCDALIEEAKTGRMVPLPGMTVKQSLEAKLNGELSKVRDECGSAAVDTLDAASNAPMIMVNSGSKGSALNTAQMMACVGQQTVSGKRIVNAFQDRSLPHFPRFAEDPASRGFVANSFYSGLAPTEFFFHTMAGREGLVDTAVKTAETGYVYRRLSKAMENLCVKYDHTVRDAMGVIVQLRYGEDGMDPWLMEGANGTPLNLEQEWLTVRAAYARTWRAAKGTTRRVITEAQHAKWHVLSLLPNEVLPYVQRCLNGEVAVLEECARREALERAEMEATATATSAKGVSDPTALSVTGGGKSKKGAGAGTVAASTTAASTTVEMSSLPVYAVQRLAAICSDRFKQDMGAFFNGKVKEQVRLRQLLALPLDRYDIVGATEKAAASATTTTTASKRGKAAASAASAESSSPSAAASAHFKESLQTELLPLTEGMVCCFLEACARKCLRKVCEPGTPCGSIAAQSVGEPSTQMTLRTFHFAGVASMSITQGVPRLIEVINANKNIATPVITAPIVVQERGLERVGSVLPSLAAAAAAASSPSSSSPATAASGKAQATSPQGDAARRQLTCRAVRGLVERVLLKEITIEMVELVSANTHVIQIYLNMPLIKKLLLPIDASVVRQRILLAAAKPLSPLRRLREHCVELVSQDSLVVYPYETDAEKVHFNIQSLLTALPEIVVGGVVGINRVMIAKNGEELLAEGAELRPVMVLPHVDGTRTSCNHVAVIERTLGIEAARQTIVNEINSILKAYSLSIDIRHIYLLADVMTSRGVVLGITRYGIQKMNHNVLTLASFERTSEHLYNAAVMQRSDTKLSVSESIIIGKPVPLGTSSFSLLLDKGVSAQDGGSGAAGGASTTTAPLTSAGMLPPLMQSWKTTKKPLQPRVRGGLVGQGKREAAGEWGGGSRPRVWPRSPPLFADGTFHVDVFV